MISRILPYVLTTSIIVVILLPSTLTGGQEEPFPRLANYFLGNTIADRDREILSRWDLLVLSYRLDDNPQLRDRLSYITQLNQDVLMLIYTCAAAVNRSEVPPGPMEVACDQYDWWLRDYQGNMLNEPSFPWSYLINMTNTEAAPGSHPQGKKANRYLAELMVENHLLKYGYWSGIFYDVFSDNLGWLYKDQKDGNRNGKPEYDDSNNGNEPKFNDLWWDGSLTLMENTVSLKADAILIGNGLHRGALDASNGRMTENFTKSGSKNLSYLCTNYQYLTNGTKMPRVSIVNGWLKDQNSTAYKEMRFSFCATLMTDNYYSCDFGSQHHGETLWFDEYSVVDNGDVNARVTHLAESISHDQEDIRVESTEGFRENGIIEIAGEQIYYDSKSEHYFHDCFRGYPCLNKYDLRAAHATGSLIIQHYSDHTDYLGKAVAPAFDANEPWDTLDEFFEQAGWSAGDEIAEIIDRRVWQRDFENGTVIVNPTPNPGWVFNLGNGRYRKINGLQDHDHNDGSIVYESVWIESGDGIVLISVNEEDSIPPAPPGGFRFKP